MATDIERCLSLLAELASSIVDVPSTPINEKGLDHHQREMQVEAPTSNTDSSHLDGSDQKVSQLRERRRVTTAEKKRAVKARLQEQGIAWDPKKYSGNKHRYNKKKRAGDLPASHPAQTKRGSTESSTPSSMESLTKKPKQEAEETTISSAQQPRGTGSYKEASTSTKVAIVPVTYPEMKLNEAQGKTIEELLMKKIIESEPFPDGSYPIFEGTFMECGAFMVSCSNQQTNDWVIGLTPDLGPLQGNIKLIAGSRRNVLKCSKVLIKVPENLKGTSPNKIRNMLDRQNPDLRMDKWKLLSSREESRGLTMIFLANDEAIPSIHAAHGKVHVGLWKASLLLLDDRDRERSTNAAFNRVRRPWPPVRPSPMAYTGWRSSESHY